LAHFVRLSVQRAAYVAWAVPRFRKFESAPVGMTKSRGGP
jgi:hypothetical protein